MYFSSMQVSIFYTMIIVLLAYLGYQRNQHINRFLNSRMIPATTSFLGGLLGLTISYMMFLWASERGMIVDIPQQQY